MIINHSSFSTGNISFDIANPVTDTLMYINYTGVKMASNSAVGNMLYHAPQPHAVSEAQPVNNSVIPADQCNLTYNIFNLTRTINEADTRYDITYYPNQSRAMTIEHNGTTTTAQRVYCGREYEHNLTTHTRYNYIYAGNMPVALYVQGDTNALYTLHTNHLGSIEKISDQNGNVADSMSYSPFGLRRSVGNWSQTDTAPHFTDRGFTGQQHLDNFGLINFNANS